MWRRVCRGCKKWGCWLRTGNLWGPDRLATKGMGNKPRTRAKTKATAAKKKSPSRAAPRATTPVEQKPKRPWGKWLIWGGGAVGLVVLLALAFGSLGGGSADPPEGIERYFGLPAAHTDEPVAYEQSPPVGGLHSPAWQNCGYYSTPIPNELGVHSLEHGVVWITYQPELDQDSVDVLRDFADQPEVLVSPYPGLDVPVVASTWGNQIRLDGADDPRLSQFVISMKNGPDTPEPNGTCTGGVGNPE